MTQFLLHTPPTITQSSSTFSTILCSLKPHKNSIANSSSSNTKPVVVTIPATDRVIDFGKHKGKMLGTLPSSYLKWVSKNLRAQDFEQWAKLADQVLDDPVYRDRIEWEFAENLLTGNNNDIKNKHKNKKMVVTNEESSVSQLLEELSERFGWDNEDKDGWSKLNFELLGTTKGGRIPRMLEKEEEKEMMMKVEKEERDGGGGLNGLLLSESEESRRRRERRIRVMENMARGKIGNGNGNENGDGGGGGGDERRRSQNKKKSDPDLTREIYNPFPGREALLKKVMSRKRFL